MARHHRTTRTPQASPVSPTPPTPKSPLSPSQKSHAPEASAVSPTPPVPQHSPASNAAPVFPVQVASAPATPPVPQQPPTPIITQPSFASGPSANVQRRLDWLWQQRLRLQMRVQEVQATMDVIALEIQAIQRRQQWLTLQRPQVIVGVLLHPHGSSPQEHAYQQECTWLRNQEWSARSRWTAHSAQWTALQQSLAHLDAEELALRGFPRSPHPPFHLATF